VHPGLDELRALLSREGLRPALYYWRTHAGAEVDFVIERGERLLPIEVKWSAAPSAGDLRGLHSFLDDHADRAPFGIVLHRASEPVALDRRVLGLPLAAPFLPANRR